MEKKGKLCTPHSLSCDDVHYASFPRKILVGTQTLRKKLLYFVTGRSFQSGITTLPSGTAAQTATDTHRPDISRRLFRPPGQVQRDRCQRCYTAAPGIRTRILQWSTCIHEEAPGCPLTTMTDDPGSALQQKQWRLAQCSTPPTACVIVRSCA